MTRVESPAGPVVGETAVMQRGGLDCGIVKPSAHENPPNKSCLCTPPESPASPASERSVGGFGIELGHLLERLVM